jgi:small subunit ribosomal protein S20
MDMSGRNVGFPLASSGPHRQNSRLFLESPCPWPISSQPKSVARQTVKRRARNVAARSKLRTAIKSVVAAVNAGDKKEAAAKLKEAGPVIDSAVNKGVIHRKQGVPPQEPPERPRQGNVRLTPGGSRPERLLDPRRSGFSPTLLP